MPELREDQKMKVLLGEVPWPNLKVPEAEVEKVLRWLEQPQHHLIAYGDLSYPYLLTKIDHPPPFLSVCGHLEVLSEPQLGMVGCRNMSHYGAENAFSFAKALAEIGLVVTSGLARGIDALSHEGAMQAGGLTIAVLGTGLHQVYPREHQALADRIAETGAVISQFPLHNGPLRHQFPMRNRVISGLSLGVLVVEAAQKSGSLITARYALQQNREVFAIPGSIHSVTSKGCHALIRDGATLVDSLPELLMELKEKLK
jgi:DNA processing protein